MKPRTQLAQDKETDVGNIAQGVSRLLPLDRRYLLSGSFEARTSIISEEVLRRASFRGEAAVAILRLILCGLLLLREIYILVNGMAFSSPKRWLLIGFTSLGMVCSVLFLATKNWWMKNRLSSLLYLSVFCDSLIYFAGGFVLISMPAPGTAGYLYLPYNNILYIVIIGSGLRLLLPVAITASLVNMIGFGLLIVVEKGNILNYPGGLIAFHLIILLTSILIAILIADRTTRLVNEGAATIIEAERVRERLGAYLGRELAEEALHAGDFHLGGVRQPCAVLFVNLRKPPASLSGPTVSEEFVKQLNEYLEEMAKVIKSAGGVVDKYLGDGLMAVFGVPRSKGNDAARALRAALDMQVALSCYNQKRLDQGLPQLAQGIGIHYGNVVAGNVGTMDHAQYTVVGDVVNVASRLQKATKDLDVPILFSEELQRAIQPRGTLPARQLQIRGRQAALTVYGISD